MRQIFVEYWKFRSRNRKIPGTDSTLLSIELNFVYIKYNIFVCSFLIAGTFKVLCFHHHLKSVRHSAHETKCSIEQTLVDIIEVLYNCHVASIFYQVFSPHPSTNEWSCNKLLFVIPIKLCLMSHAWWTMPYATSYAFQNAWHAHRAFSMPYTVHCTLYTRSYWCVCFSIIISFV